MSPARRSKVSGDMPERIWATPVTHAVWSSGTWCDHSVGADTEYVRADLVSTLSAKIERLEAALAIQDQALSDAAVTFMAYAINHREKTPPDTIKAERNDYCADKCRDARENARAALASPDQSLSVEGK